MHRILSIGLLAHLASSCASSGAGAAPRRLPPGVEPLEVREAAAPQVGDRFPNVSVLDSSGSPVDLWALTAEAPYTVVTLGCLT